MKGISLKVRLSKKRLIGAATCLLVAGGGGAYALQSGLLSDAVAEVKASQPSGVACTTTDFIKLNRGGQRWLRKYVRTDSVDGIERVRTALRVAGVLAKAEKADLYQVVVLDRAGPEGRANLRGAAIGAEVLFAPDPTKLPDMDQPFIARYADGRANPVGLFYGERKTLSPEDIRTALTEMTDRTDCETLVADSSAPVEGDTGGAHGKPASGHGESASEGKAAPAEGHGEAADAKGEAAEGHGEAAEADAKPSEGHEPAAAAAASGHEAAPEGEEEPAAKGGWFATVTAMIPGMGGETQKAEGAPPEEAGGAQTGVLSTVMRLIPGMGGDTSAPPAATTEHAPAEQAVTVPEAGHEAGSKTENAKAEAHGPAAEEASQVTKASPQGAAEHAPETPEPAHEAAVPHEVTTEETGATH
ncbi:hypothetical protein ASG39_12320 [Rhizobium sp. Leaf371]|uniref:hypothetical protein n=1 Tax=Rhizobium sp. Leaf371 TaxID=1736355 RepID=UPI0007157D9D|nr:hypothetical protein [Rhizobium sp. Leaf371]KQS64706.1 hypothetical protein ASG39_12320 [Rhizobium sp. Leaf371]